MFLSDSQIALAQKDGDINLDPYTKDRIQPASYDLTLVPNFIYYGVPRTGHSSAVIDPRTKSDDLTEKVDARELPGGYFLLHPGQFALASTVEHVSLSPRVLAMLNGKSSLGRLGLIVHATAGFVDPGWKGRLTLELSNVNQLPIKLWPGMAIAQLVFAWLGIPAVHPYGSEERPGKYQGQTGPEISRHWRAPTERPL